MSEDNVTNEVVYLHSTISSCFSNNDIDADSIVTSPVLCSEWNDASGKQCLSFVTCTGSNYKVLI